MNVVRSVLAVLAGLLLISAIVEPIEFVLVVLVNGGVTTDPDVYFAVRNRGPLLAAKLVYNTAAAVAGGLVTAWIARRSPVVHGIALGVVQTVAFAWAMGRPDLRRTTPDWMWVALIVLTFAGVVCGAVVRRRRMAVHTPQQAKSAGAPSRV